MTAPTSCDRRRPPASWPKGWAIPFAAGALAGLGCGTDEPMQVVPPDADVDAEIIDLPDVARPDPLCQGPCPATPNANGPCVSGTMCTYGNDPRFDCRVLIVCEGDHWERAPSPRECLAASSVTTCPETTAADGTACVEPSLCAVQDGACRCVGGAWKCRACAVQNLGNACTAKDGWCSGVYTCSFVSCLCGRWTSVLHTCE